MAKRRRSPAKKAPHQKPELDLTEQIESSSDEEEPALETDDSSSDEEDLETKKVRLAREYLDRLEGDEGSSSEEEDDEDEEEDDRVSRKLQRERLKREGTFFREIADGVQSRLAALSSECGTTTASWVEQGHISYLRGHDLSVTSVALQSDGRRAVSGSKDHSVLLWDLETSQRIGTLAQHWKKTNESRTRGEVLSVALSDEGQYAAVGARNGTVRIFDVRSSSTSPVQTFTGHKSAVTCLAFRTNTLQLFSGSEDRTIRHYNLQEMMYLETLYGHQFVVSDIDCHRQERPISVGRDRTARAWKLAEDTHLIFRGGARLPPADAVAVTQDKWFATGHEDGQLCLWMTEKKRAVATQTHGSLGVVSLEALASSDLLASGSSDGYLRFWKARMGPTLDERGLDAIGSVPMPGYINDITFGPKANICVLALGREHRLGRWNPLKNAKNRLAVIRLGDHDTTKDSDEEEDPRDDDENGDDTSRSCGESDE